MRVLLVHNYYRRGSPGGEDSVFEAERSMLVAAGHEVAVYTRSNDELQETRWRDRWQGVSQLLFPARASRELAEIFDSFHPQIVHAHNLFPLIGSALLAVAGKRNVPIVQTLHNYRVSCLVATHFRNGAVCNRCCLGNPLSGVLHGCFRNSKLASAVLALATTRWARRLKKTPDAVKVIALTEFAADRLRREGLSHEQIFIRPNFFNPPPVGTDTSLAVSRDGKPYAVFSGRLSEEKGVLDLLSAWREVNGVTLKILGDGPLRSTIEARVSSGGLDVELLGMCSRADTLRVVAGALFQIVPSRWFEGMPLVVLEAWGLGVPVLASRIGGLEEMMANGNRGLLFELGDAESLTYQIRALIGSEALRHHLRDAGLAAVKDHEYGRSVRSLEAIYSSVINR